MDSEIIVYISKLRKYFETNREARDYFIGELDQEIFLERATEVAMKNFHDKGDPALNVAQFEFIKKILNTDVIKINNVTSVGPIIFIDDRGLEIIKKKE